MAEGGPGGDGKSINIDVASFTPKDGVISVGAKDAVTGAPVQAEALSSGDSDRFRTLSETKEVKSKNKPENSNAARNIGENKQNNNKSETKHPQKESPTKNEHSSDNKSKDDEKKEKGVKPEEDFRSMDFSELNSLRKNFSIEGARRQRAEDEFNRRIKNFTELREGELVGEIRHRYLNLVRNTNWDGLYGAITTAATELEASFARSTVGQNHPELRGIITEVLRVERAQLLLEGMRRNNIRDTNTAWLRSHGYTTNEITRFRELSLPINAVLDIERTPVNTLANMVGQDIVVNRPQQSPLTAADMTTAVRDGTKEALGRPTEESVEKQYKEYEKNMSLPEIGIELPSFLVGKGEKEIAEWRARSILSAACADKIKSRTLDDLSKGPEIQKFTLEKERDILSINGVVEAVSMELLIMKYKLNPNDVFGDTPNCPDSIFGIGTDIQLEGFRQAKINWLVRNRNLTRSEAEVAEVVSRNYNFLKDALENFDSKYDEDGNLAFPDHAYASAAMSNVKSMTVWQGMHTMERLIAKTDGRETWGMYGPWGTKRQDLGEDISKQKVLPISLFPSALELKDGDGNKVIDYFIENGRRLINSPSIDRFRLLMPNLSSGKLKVGQPYYSINVISPANTILTAITSPAKFVGDPTWATSLGNAFRNCEVPVHYREKIVLGLTGINVNSRTPKSVKGWLYFRDYKQAIASADPLFWK